jgi:hypothetical protein
MSLIRGVMLAGKFRSQHQLNAMSPDDMRNTLIVEIAGRSRQTNLQSFDDDTLAGMGAVLVFLRTARIRDDAALKGMTSDDMRNILIVELGGQTGMSGPALQAMSNIELVKLALGKPQPGGLTAGSFVRGVLLAGQFRTQHELDKMSSDDMRNTLIVEMTAHSNQANYQAFNDFDLAGMGAVMVFLREARLRTDAELKTMSADDQRNVAIVEIGSQTNLGSKLQGLRNMDLVRIALGVDPEIVFKPLPPPLQPPIQQPPAGTGDEPSNPELGDKMGKGDDGPEKEPAKDPPPESGPTQSPDNQTPQEKCFIGNTPVLMADGLTKTIDAIVIGDQVVAREEKTGTTAVGSVARIFRHHVAETLLLQMEGGEVVETTAAHRFAVEKRGFVSAGELRPGDTLFTHNDRRAEVVSIEARSAQATVYNLSVDRFHTFFVGRAGLWVHNLKKSDPPLPEPPDPPESD